MNGIPHIEGSSYCGRYLIYISYRVSVYSKSSFILFAPSRSARGLIQFKIYPANLKCLLNLRGEHERDAFEICRVSSWERVRAHWPPYLGGYLFEFIYFTLPYVLFDYTLAVEVCLVIVHGTFAQNHLVFKYILIISKYCSNEFINYEALYALALVHIYDLHLSFSLELWVSFEDCFAVLSRL